MEKLVIKNTGEIVTTQLRKDALEILEAGYEAINTEKVIESEIKVDGGHLVVSGIDVDLSSYERVIFVGIGKCAADAAVVFERLLGEYLSEGIVIDVRGVVLQKIISRVGTHPLPSKENIEATQAVTKLLQGVTDRDLVLTVISGGGSALLCLPHDIQCEMLVNITKTLMSGGATIEELNTVRKHLSMIQGGQFAKLAYPARVVSVIFSDVPGNDMATVASGPTVLDTTTKEDAERILAEYNILTVCKLPGCEVFETPKDEKYFTKVDNILLLTNNTAINAMGEKAKELKYRPIVADDKVEGDASTIGRLIATQAKEKSCILYGGERTVMVKGTGKGGRNQELVLGALPELGEHTVVVAAASDGWDNSDVAGAIGDKELFEKATSGGVDIGKFLGENNSYEFFNTMGGHIKTGRTGSNVSDLYFTLTS